MLVDERNSQIYTGSLDSHTHHQHEWLSTLVALITSALPDWRDDPKRPKETGENKLTSQLCAYLNTLVRHKPGWDYLQFKREEPDDTYPNRVLDLVTAPSGTIINIEGREYTQYQILLPIECKRLPVPSSTKRDPREYIYSNLSSTGGIQRFKAGHHGAAHLRAVMIAYIQEQDILYWKEQINEWINELSLTIKDWTPADLCHLIDHNISSGIATLNSVHNRVSPLNPILLDHLWVEIHDY